MNIRRCASPIVPVALAALIAIGLTGALAGCGSSNGSSSKTTATPTLQIESLSGAAIPANMVINSGDTLNLQVALTNLSGGVSYTVLDASGAAVTPSPVATGPTPTQAVFTAPTLASGTLKENFRIRATSTSNSTVQNEVTVVVQAVGTVTDVVQ